MGDRIKSSRIKQGLTQGEVAEYLGIARPTYTHYESGRSEPDLESLTKMASLFQTSVDYLLTGKNQDSPISEAQVSSVSKTEEPQEKEDWHTLAQMLAKALQMHEETAKLQAEAMKMQAENERLRIEKVDAVAQDNLRRILDKLDQLEAGSHSARRGDEGAAGNGESLVG